ARLAELSLLPLSSQSRSPTSARLPVGQIRAPEPRLEGALLRATARAGAQFPAPVTDRTRDSHSARLPAKPWSCGYRSDSAYPHRPVGPAALAAAPGPTQDG